MKNINIVVIALYQIACISLVVFWVYLLSKQFIDNKDSTEVTYKKFGSNVKNEVEYPTFSICTPGKVNFYPLVDTPLYQELYNHSACQDPSHPSYDSVHHWCEIGLYQKMLRGEEEITPSASKQDVDSIINSLLPKIGRWQFLEDNGGWKPYNKKSIYASYQDSTRVCFTKKREPGLGRNHTYDLFAISGEHINSAVEIYVHKIGGLIEQLGKKYVFQMSHQAIKELYTNFQATSESYHTKQGITVFHDIHVRKIEILRKRPNAIKACNNSISDNDKTYMQTVMNSIGCIPSYWRRFVDNITIHLPECDRTNQYEKFANMLPNTYENTNLQRGAKLYTQPCTEMKISTSMDKRHVRTMSHNMWITFYYDSDEYKEVLNNQAFTANDLWSQIGGIVGIFLGYSCLQVTFNSFLHCVILGISLNFDLH